MAGTMMLRTWVSSQEAASIDGALASVEQPPEGITGKIKEEAKNWNLHQEWPEMLRDMSLAILDLAKEQIKQGACAQESVSKPTSRGSKAEFNIRAREYLRKHHDAKRREVALAVGCSESTVCRLSAWQAVSQERIKRRKRKAKPAVSLSKSLEEKFQLQRLIHEQRQDGYKQYKRA